MPAWGLVAVAFPAQSTAGECPVLSTGTGSAVVRAVLGLGGTGSHPGGVQEWIRPFRSSCSPWHGDSALLVCSRAGRGKGSPRNAGVRTGVPYPATEGCEEQRGNPSSAASRAGEQQLFGPGLPHPLRTGHGRARAVRDLMPIPRQRAVGSAVSDSPCPSSSGLVPPLPKPCGCPRCGTRGAAAAPRAEPAMLPQPALCAHAARTGAGPARPSLKPTRGVVKQELCFVL